MSAVADGGLVVSLDGPAVLKMEDRSKSFADMKGHWAESNTDFVTGHGLFQGTSETTFDPDGTMTRGMVTTVLYRMMGEPETGAGRVYADVDPESWYGKAVRWATDAAVAAGVGEDAFAPDLPATREELVSMLWRCAGAEEGSADLTAFTDHDAVSAGAAEAVRWAVGAGILNGKDGGRLDPSGTATRAEVAALLQRFVTYTVTGGKTV